MKNNPFINLIGQNNFRSLWLGQIISQVALNMLNFVLVIKVYKDTGSSTAVSLMLLSFSVPSIFFGLIAGGIVDFYDRKKIMFWCNVLRAFLLVFYFIFASNLLMIYILSILISLITQLFIPAEGPSIPNLVSEKFILTANSMFTVSFYFSTVLGYILAGPAIKQFGSEYVYLFMSFLMFLSAYFIHRLPFMKVKNVRNGNMDFSFIKKTYRDVLSFIKKNERIRQSLILMTFSQSLISILAVLAPGFSDKVLAIDLNDASFLVLGPAAIGLIIGALWVGQFGMKFLKGSIILFGLISLSVILISISLITSDKFVPYSHYLSFLPFGMMGITMMLLLMLGLFNSFVSVPASAILQEDTDENMRGRIYGILTSLTGGVSVAPIIFSGLMADYLGVNKTLMFMGLTVFALGLIEYFKRVRNNQA
jgi:MFS family permease